MAEPELVEAASAALSVSPATLRFAFTIGKANIQSLRLSHTGSVPYAVAFKVRTSNPRRYTCRPATGFLGPGAQQQVSVKLAAQYKISTDYTCCDDRFKVFFHVLDPRQVVQRSRDISDIWPRQDAGTIVFKIKCIFTPGFTPHGAKMRIVEEGGNIRDICGGPSHKACGRRANDSPSFLRLYSSVCTEREVSVALLEGQGDQIVEPPHIAAFNLSPRSPRSLASELEPAVQEVLMTTGLRRRRSFKASDS